MISCRMNPILVIFYLLSLMVLGCNNADSPKTEKLQVNTSPLIGAWEKIAEGQKQASAADVTMIISEHTLAMNAPGCLIAGTYTVADGVLTFTVTSADGTRCAPGQSIGKSDSVQFTVTDSQLTLIPLLAGEERKLVYQRVGEQRR